MSLFSIVLRSLRQHLLSTSVTAVAIALAGGLLMSVWVVKTEAKKNFTRINAGFDAVLGPRSAKLQLVLNSVFHLEASPGLLSPSDVADIRKHPAVELAVPIAVGDNYHGYRIVGTLTNMLTDVEYAAGRKYRLASGRMFDPLLRESVVGSFAARKLGLKVGDTFHPFHGLNFDPNAQHEETYVVVGVLEPSNTPADRVLWISLAGVQQMGGHDPALAGEVSAVLVKLRKGAMQAGFRLDTMYNKQGDRLTFAWPMGTIMAQLFDKIGWFDQVLALVAYLVALVAAGSILASIYNSMNERRRDIAILRALGARRRLIFGTVVLESAAIAALGMVLAFAFYAVIVGIAAAVIQAQTGVVLDAFAPHAVMLWAPLGMIALGALAGVVPAWKAYRTPVAENLVPVS
jgi:putative ABC transport system permease protein